MSRTIFAAFFILAACSNQVASMPDPVDVPEGADAGDAAATMPDAMTQPTPAADAGRPDALPAQRGPDAGATGQPSTDAGSGASDAAHVDGGAVSSGDAGGDGAVPFLCTVPDKASAAATLALVQMDFPTPCPGPERAPMCATFADPRLPGQWVTKPVECRCGHWAYAWVPTAGGEQSVDVREAFACSAQCAPGTLCKP